MSVVTNQPIQLSYFVQDITTALLTYNRLRWHRSRTGQYGLYEPTTADLPTPAILVGTNPTPFSLNSRTLKFRVNGVTTVSVLFTDPDPVTIAQVIVAITTATPLVVATDDGMGRLELTTVTTGSGSSIEILESDAAPYLGFSTGDGAVGQDMDTVLLPATHEYFYTDQNSDREFWYRVEFRHNVTLKTTGLGVPFPANQTNHISKSKTMVAYIRLSDMSGNPIGCRNVTFANPFLPNTVLDQTLNWGVFRHFATIQTDRNGYAEIRILRGMTVDMSIDGTNFVRRLTIPLLGDAVDLLDPSIANNDEFQIQQPDIDFAIRTI